MRLRTALVLISPLLLLTPVAHALDFTLETGLSESYTDNSLKASEDEQSDYLTRLDGRFGLDHEGKSWTLNMDYSAFYTNYDKNTQSDSTEVNGNAAVQYEQFENVLFWNASNSVRSVLNDQSLQDTTDNRQNRSISTFSPELLVPITRVDSLSAIAAYSRVSYQDSNQQDSDRTGGKLGWIHRLSAVDSIELSWEYYDVNFDDSVSDYDYYSTRLSYASTLSQLSYTLSAGYNKTQRKVFDDTDGPYINANFVYDGGVSQWELTVLREITDTSRGDNNESITDLGDSANVDGFVDVYEVISGELAYTTEAVCSVCVVRVSLLSAREEYDVLRDDNLEFAGRVQFNYNFSRRSSIDANVSYTDYSFMNKNPRSDYGLQSYILSFQHRFTRNFSGSIFVQFEKRDSDVSTENYDEAGGGVRVSYQFL